jgi:hypothetical protein
MTAAHPPVSHEHRSHMNPWLLAVIILSAALVALGAWVLVDREQATTTTAQTVSRVLSFRDVKTTLNGRRAAMNAADLGALATFYASNAVLDDLNGGSNTVGSWNIADYVYAVREQGYLLRANGEPILLGDRYVVEPVTLYAKGKPVSTGTTGANVFEFDGNGKIVHEWMTILR